jgi:hypothetical protein
MSANITQGRNCKFVVVPSPRADPSSIQEWKEYVFQISRNRYTIYQGLLISILLLYWGYIVTCIKVFMIYLS